MVKRSAVRGCVWSQLLKNAAANSIHHQANLEQQQNKQSCCEIKCLENPSFSGLCFNTLVESLVVSLTGAITTMTSYLNTLSNDAIGKVGKQGSREILGRRENAA